MKKVIVLMSVALGCYFTTMAQGGGQMTPEQRLAAQKERYKSLGLNDAQVDSVVAITSDFRPKMMLLRDLPEADRAVKMKEINEERNKRIEKAFPAEIAKKIIDAMSQQRQRPPGGGGK